MEKIRSCYYQILKKISGTGAVIQKFTGFGLYDKCVIDALGKYKIAEPFFRGLVAEVGFSRTEVPFIQEKRQFGHTSHTFFMLYDIAILGFVNNSKAPLRLAILFSALMGCLSFIAAVVYFVLKLCFWNEFNMGVAPLIIGMFFVASIQLFFIGILGEYLGAIWTQVRQAPLVIEEEMLNFDKEGPQ